MGRGFEAAVEAVAADYPGPGGAVAVLRDGAVLARHAFGWADAERRVPFTAATPFRMCSITKQFTCALVADLFGDPGVLDDDVRAAMPGLAAPPPARTLCHNQSGLRDYWALAMACGAAVEGRFGDAEARALIGRTRTAQFAPGSRYSYANQNFRILSDIAEARTGRSFEDLLRARIFEPAGMERAFVAAETEALDGGTVGYEGSVEAGFRAAVNRICWTGDAGLAACLDDMIAWERFIDATRGRADGLFWRIAAPVSFADGREAAYGFGLSRARMLGEAALSHAGALRGWRSFRAYLPGRRVSVVVMFNHMGDARAAALSVLGALLGEGPGASKGPATVGVPRLEGRFIEPETGLAVRVEGGRLHFTGQAETLGTGPNSVVEGTDGVWMERPGDGMSSRLAPAGAASASGVEGTFVNDELGATLTCARSGGVTYGAFSGVLGEGMMQALLPFGEDVWLLPCPRALDHAPPGDWTLRGRRDGAGRVVELQVGCWLARGLMFRRAGG